LLNDIYPELIPFFLRLREQFNHDVIRDILFAFDCFSKLLLKQQGKAIQIELVQSVLQSILNHAEKHTKTILHQQIEFIFMSLNWILTKLNDEPLKNKLLTDF